MFERDYKSKFKSSAEVLQNMLSPQKEESSRQKQFKDHKKTVREDQNLADQFFRWKLWLNWSEIAGPTLSEHCEPISFQNGVLVLWVKNSIWATQINFMSQTLKSTIHKKMNVSCIKEVKTTLDRKNVPDKNDQQFRKFVKHFINE